jgi:lipoprotein-releasing system ATP-binding protein
MNLTDKAHKKPNELSGGEQQRIAIARALINKPAIVFADEPTGNLDSHNAQSIHELFSKLRTELQQTFVIVTHNEHLAKSTDRVIKMQDGLIIA